MLYPSVAVLFSVATLALAATPLSLPLSGIGPTSDDFSPDPDGPWQKVAFGVGTSRSNRPQAVAYGYPCGSSFSQILSPAAGGSYLARNSSTAESTNVTVFNPDAWIQQSVWNISSGDGVDVIDTVHIGDLSVPGHGFSDLNGSVVTLPGGSTYSVFTGILALGPDITARQSPSVLSAEASVTSITEYLKRNGTIPSSSWSFQQGSVLLSWPGSLILGGYDSSRALGKVWTTDLLAGLPAIVLKDITIGVEQGGSPFRNKTAIGSLFRGNGGSNRSSDILQQFGGGSGNDSVVVVINPAVPYIFLPAGSCEAIAALLPVTWKPELGLYTWNTGDPQYERIVGSAATLDFVFADTSALNLTIKVPFVLLNLTLQTPITSPPVPYFPCAPTPNAPHGFWEFGRAFLQAAYFGIHWDQNKVFLAQAPGPKSGPTAIKSWQPTDITMQSANISSFADSWSSVWTLLPVPKNDADGSDGGSRSLSTAGKAGIIVGALVAALLVAGLILFIIRGRKKAELQGAKTRGSPVEKQVGNDETGHFLPREMENNYVISEAGVPLAHEAGSRTIIQEAGSNLIHELPAESNG